MSKYKDIHFRVDEEEHEKIKMAAHESGKTLSEYGRDVLLAASNYETTMSEQNQSEDNVRISQPEKSSRFYMRVSPDEMEYYIEQSQKVGCSVSEYVRRCADGNTIYVVDGLPELTRQIAKLGVNINQLTMLAHQGKIKEVDLFACNDTLKQILKQLLKLTKKKR